MYLRSWTRSFFCGNLSYKEGVSLQNRSVDGSTIIRAIKAISKSVRKPLIRWMSQLNTSVPIQRYYCSYCLTSCYRIAGKYARPQFGANFTSYGLWRRSPHESNESLKKTYLTSPLISGSYCDTRVIEHPRCAISILKERIVMESYIPTYRIVVSSHSEITKLNFCFDKR